MAQETILFEKDGLAGVVLTACYFEETVDLLTHIWVTQNIPTRALGITADEYRPLAEYYVRQALKYDYLGQIIIDRNSNNKVVGFYIAADAYEHPTLLPASLSLTLSPKFVIHSKYLQDTEVNCFKEIEAELTRPGVVLRAIAGGILPEHAGGGYMRTLYLAILKLYELHRIKYTIDTATHPVSHLMGKKFGHKELGRTYWKDWVYVDGTIPFINVTESDCGIAFVHSVEGH